MTELFKAFELKNAKLRNRIAVPPMCQYMAENGFVNDWHTTHYSALARGGSGLVIVEATAISPEGRISPHCLGIWDDSQREGLSHVARLIKEAGAVPGIQLAHAGRKASAHRPWDGDDHIPNDDPQGWQTLAPSAIAFGGNLTKVPLEMTKEDIVRIQEDFVAGAQRAIKAGFEWIELHFAHGYLGQSFISKHSNHRTDEYGGSLENRGRFAREVITKIKKVLPPDIPLTIRFGVLEFDEHDEETLQDSISLIKEWKELGVDLISVSMGFSIPNAKIPWGPAFLAPIAKRIRRETKIPVSSAWGFGEPTIANNAIKNQVLDLVLVGHAHLENPNWPYQAALTLKKENPSWVLPVSYAHWLAKYHRPSEL
jgi:2,4-dienoyl-CoA reductase-like NADH-dependent reductase (Old Yellow Enzyme family)